MAVLYSFEGIKQTFILRGDDREFKSKIWNGAEEQI